jgi:photosystem II stability/assembly factor-like uncharacterized protein
MLRLKYPLFVLNCTQIICNFKGIISIPCSMAPLRTSISMALLLAALLFPFIGAYPQSGWETLFYDNFDEGHADQWILDEGWSIRPSGEGFELAGENHHWARCRQGTEWYDYNFAFSINRQAGGIHVNFRVSNKGRYMLGFSGEELYLTRDLQWGNYTPLESLPIKLSEGIWHRVEVHCNLKAIQVFLDGEPVIQVWDEEALLSGSVAFETLENSLVYIDSIEITGPPYLEPPEGYDWIRTGGPPGGLGYDIRIHPGNPEIVIVTDNPSGFNKSYDGGRTWHRRNDGITIRSGSSNEDIPIFSATIDPGNPDNIWCGTQNVTSIFKSEDGGESWIRKDQSITDYGDVSFRGFAIHPSNSDIVLAAGEIPTEFTGRTFNMTKGVIYKTEDGGATWSNVWTGENLARVLLFDYLRPDTIYCSTGIFDREAFNSDKDLDIPGGVGILRSFDGGESWTEVNQGIENLYAGYLEMHPEDPRTLFAATGNHAYRNPQGQILKTTNGGDSWRMVLEGRCFSAIAISKSNPDVMYALDETFCFRSDDGGETWSAYQKEDQGVWGPPGIKPGIPISAAVDPNDENRLFVNNYNGGNFLSADGGQTWVNSSDGYTGADIRDILMDPDHPAVAVASGRNGIFKTVNGGKDWFGITNGDAGTDLNTFDALDTDLKTLIGAADGEMSIIATRDGGLDWKPLYIHDSTVTSGAGFHRFSEIVVAPSDTRVIYAGMDHTMNIGNLDPDAVTAYGMYVSADGGANWTQMNQGLGPAARTINTIAVHPDSAEVVYVGTLADGIYRSRNGGQSWEAVNHGLGSSDIRSIAIDPVHPNVLYAGTGNGFGIYKSNTSGDLWEERNRGIQLLCPSYASSFGRAVPGMDLGQKKDLLTGSDYSQLAWTKILDIAIDPSNTQHVFAADYSTGIHFSSDGGNTWASINDGISLKTATCLTISGDGSVLYAGIKGNGVLRMVLENKAPGIQRTIPDDSETVVVFLNDTVEFTVVDYDLNGDSLTYQWFVDQQPSDQMPGAGFSLMTHGMEPGMHTLGVTISDPDTSVQVLWNLDVRELATNLEALQEPGPSERIIQIYPNPFSEVVHIRYLVPFDADVTVEISDLMGRHVWEKRSGRQPAGSHLIHWDGLDRQHGVVPVGIYVVRVIYRARAEILIQERKIVFTR